MTCFHSFQFVFAVAFLPLMAIGVEEHLKRGREAVARKDYDRAIAYFSDAIRFDAKQSLTYAYRGFAYAQKKDYDRAISDFSEAIRLNTKDAWSYYSRGTAYLEKRDYDRAIVDFGEAILLDPRHEPAYGNRGVAYFQKQDYDRAIADLSEAIRLEPKQAPTYALRGRIYVEKQDYDRAVADFTDAIRLNPREGSVYSNLARVLATCREDRVRDGKKAVQYATKACELSAWKDPIDLSNLVAAYAEVGQFAEAVKWQKKVLGFPEFVEEYGENAEERLEQYEEGKPYREE